jgi:hypothetical protein
MTYTIHAAKDGEKCYNCAEQADIVLVADTHERETGHVDEVPLCDKCKSVYLNAWQRGER